MTATLARRGTAARAAASAGVPRCRATTAMSVPTIDATRSAAACSRPPRPTRRATTTSHARPATTAMATAPASARCATAMTATTARWTRVESCLDACTSMLPRGHRARTATDARSMRRATATGAVWAGRRLRATTATLARRTGACPRAAARMPIARLASHATIGAPAPATIAATGRAPASGRPSLAPMETIAQPTAAIHRQVARSCLHRG